MLEKLKRKDEKFFRTVKKRSKTFSSRTSVTTKGAVIINAGGGAGRYWGGGTKNVLTT